MRFDILIFFFFQTYSKDKAFKWLRSLSWDSMHYFSNLFSTVSEASRSSILTEGGDLLMTLFSTIERADWFSHIAGQKQCCYLKWSRYRSLPGSMNSWERDHSPCIKLLFYVQVWRGPSVLLFFFFFFFNRRRWYFSHCWN